MIKTIQLNSRNNLNLQTTIAGILSCVVYIYIALNSRSYGDFNLSQLLCTSFVCAAISFWVWYIHDRQNQDVNIQILIVFAVLFRLIGGFSFPILEDDFYRYLWDARMTVEHGSPYGIPPSSFFDAQVSDQFEVILDAINYPFVETIYGPTTQWLFALAYLISPGELWPLQLLIGLSDLLVVFLLLKLAKPTAVLLYAWSPLVIKEFVITTHPDVLGVMFILLALVLLSNKRYLTSVGVCMALACGVKIFAIMVLPFILRFEWKAWLAFIITAILIALPFGLRDAWLPGGLSAMSSDWLFNAPIYFVAELIAGDWLSLSALKFTLIGILGAASATYLLRFLMKGPNTIVHEELRGDLLYLALFLCAPAFNAWYLIWLLPFAVFRPSAWAWALSISIMFSYASGINLNNSALEAYQHSGWMLSLEFMPPVIAIILISLSKRLSQNNKN